MADYIINNPADVLEAAANEINAHGWTKGVYRNTIGNLCLLGALHTVVHGEKFFQGNAISISGVENDAFNIIKNMIGDTNIPRWNDNICSGKYEATELLRSAAKKYHEEHSS